MPCPISQVAQPLQQAAECSCMPAVLQNKRTVCAYKQTRLQGTGLTCHVQILRCIDIGAGASQTCVCLAGKAVHPGHSARQFLQGHFVHTAVAQYECPKWSDSNLCGKARGCTGVADRVVPGSGNDGTGQGFHAGDLLQKFTQRHVGIAVCKSQLPGSIQPNPCFARGAQSRRQSGGGCGGCCGGSIHRNVARGTGPPAAAAASIGHAAGPVRAGARPAGQQLAQGARVAGNTLTGSIRGTFGTGGTILASPVVQSAAAERTVGCEVGNHIRDMARLHITILLFFHENTELGGLPSHKVEAHGGGIGSGECLLVTQQANGLHCEEIDSGCYMRGLDNAHDVRKAPKASRAGSHGNPVHQTDCVG
eukprot:m.314817 g.314817  ORF g.314817 m.314817 type:complete len:364 (+) comp23064_c1_seq13:145-1236(+)